MRGVVLFVVGLMAVMCIFLVPQQSASGSTRADVVIPAVPVAASPESQVVPADAGGKALVPEKTDDAPSPPRRTEQETNTKQRETLGSSAPGEAPLTRSTVVGRESSKGPKCKYNFVRYEQSPWEALWEKRLPTIFPHQDRKMCHALTVTDKKHYDVYLRELPRCAPWVQPQHRRNDCDTNFSKAPLEWPKEEFSAMHYELQCEDGAVPPTDENGNALPKTQVAYIEPLVGLLRHPLSCTRFKRFWSNKNYMVFDEWSTRRHEWLAKLQNAEVPRVFIYELGAAGWAQDTRTFGSQRWFYFQAQSMCAKNIGTFHCWESSVRNVKQETADALRDAPELAGKYFYHNNKVSADRGSWDNALNIILNETTPDDFVILKVDFDHPETEVPLVKTLIDTPALTDRVDEFFFEHHCDIEKMYKLWHLSLTKPRHMWESPSESVEMFRKLREKGVRAHSWV